MVISQFIVAIIGITAGKPELNNQAATSAMIAFICLNIFFFASSWGPAAWVVVGEVFPLPIRSRGVGLSTASNWFWNCIIGIINPYFVATKPTGADLGSSIFFLYGGLCAVSCAFSYFLVPETKGLSLEQVDKMLEETTPRTSAKWVPHSTFATEMGLADKNIQLAGTAENVEHVEPVAPKLEV